MTSAPCDWSERSSPRPSRRGITRSEITIAGPERRHLLERLLAISRRVRDEAPVPEQLLETGARRRIVLDNEHAFGNGMLNAS